MKTPVAHVFAAGLFVISFAFVLSSPAQEKAATAPAARPDPLKPLRAFLGTWEGEARGQSGTGQATRTYTFTSQTEFTEKFGLAEPGKDFAPYSETRFRRKSP